MRYSFLVLIGTMAMFLSGCGALYDKPIPSDDFSRKAYIIGNQSDFMREVDNMTEGLSLYSYQVRHFPPTPADPDSKYRSAVDSLLKAAEGATPNDQVLISLECHGSSIGQFPLNTQEDWMTHFCCVDAECKERISEADILSVAQAFEAKAARVVIMDNSCDGGNTVLTIEKNLPKVCAMSTAGTLSPSLTSFPAFGLELIQRESNPKTFADLAGWGELRILQKYAGFGYMSAYMSGCSGDAMMLREYYSHVLYSLGYSGMSETNILREIFPEKQWPNTLKNNLAQVLSNAYYDRAHLTTFHWSWVEKALGNAVKPEYQSSFESRIPAALDSYDLAGIPRPAISFTNTAQLVNAISDAVYQALALNEQLDDLFIQLNRATDPAVRREEAAHIRALYGEMGKMESDTSRLINLFEQVECPVLKSPCAEINI